VTIKRELKRVKRRRVIMLNIFPILLYLLIFSLLAATNKDAHTASRILYKCLYMLAIFLLYITRVMSLCLIINILESNPDIIGRLLCKA
jgi:hypothetical protein